MDDLILALAGICSGVGGIVLLLGLCGLLYWLVKGESDK